MSDILLCSMPFGHVISPALGLELLKAGLGHSPYVVKVRYFSLLFAQQIGDLAYARLIGGPQQSFERKQLGEWLFSAAVFDREAGETGYVERFLRHPDPALGRGFKPEPEWFIELVLAARRQVPPFLEACLAEIEAEAPRLVGFSCTFQQTLASLALARRIKQRWPETGIVFGGAGCGGEIGRALARQFPFVDAVVSGWGEGVFPQLVERVMAGATTGGALPAGLPGVYSGAGATGAAPGGLPGVVPTPPAPYAPRPASLDDLPIPDFDEFLAQFKAAGLTIFGTPFLTIETARGCWWRDRSQCSFCSLNGAHREPYAAKSPARALREIEHFADKYPQLSLSTADLVLCEAYFSDLIPALARREKKADLFYEVRATLSKDQMRLLRAAGILHLQPGIESLDSGMLRLMRKGTTLFHNLQCLKWSRELGLQVDWNILSGFPGEAPEAYRRMAGLVPLLAHLQPPEYVAPIRIDPYSPLFEQAPGCGVTVRPSPVYDCIYPFDGPALRDLAVIYIYEYNRPQDVEGYTRDLVQAVETWRQVHPHSRLAFDDDGQRLIVHDQRPAAVAGRQEYTGLARVLYLACDEAQPVSRLQKLAAQQAGRAVSVQEIAALLRPMLDNQVMLREGQRYFSLAIPG